MAIWNTNEELHLVSLSRSVCCLLIMSIYSERKDSSENDRTATRHVQLYMLYMQMYKCLYACISQLPHSDYYRWCTWVLQHHRLTLWVFWGWISFLAVVLCASLVPAIQTSVSARQCALPLYYCTHAVGHSRKFVQQCSEIQIYTSVHTHMLVHV